MTSPLVYPARVSQELWPYAYSDEWKGSDSGVHNGRGGGEPYDLICLDIMMPEMDGQQVLKDIRQPESAQGIKTGSSAKILMTTTLGDEKNMMQAFREACNGYLVKPLDRRKVIDELKRLGFID